MDPDSANPEPSDSMSSSAQIDQVCERFEAAWKAGTPPRIEDHLDIESPSEESPPLRELLAELVKIDLDYRWRGARKGDAASSRHDETPDQDSSATLPDRPLLEDYVCRFPQLSILDQLPEDLIGYEYRARHRWGDCPEHEEYLRRFAGKAGVLSEALARIDEASSPAKLSLKSAKAQI